MYSFLGLEQIKIKEQSFPEWLIEGVKDNRRQLTQVLFIFCLQCLI